MSGRNTGPEKGAVVVDSMPLFRAGAVAALSAGGIPVVGQASALAQGIDLVRDTSATVLLLGGATFGEASEAVAALSSCAVVVLLAQPSRADLVDMLGAGVAGLALRSLTAEELVGIVKVAVEQGASAGGWSVAPVFPPFPLGLSSPPHPTSPGGELGLTPKEREVLVQLAKGASNKAIAEALYVTPATVKTHLAHIYAKLGVRGRHEALSHASAIGVLR